MHSAFEIRVIDDDHQGRNQYQGELTDEQIFHLRQVLVVLDLDMNYCLVNNLLTCSWVSSFTTLMVN